jgi:hypothetical protein
MGAGESWKKEREARGMTLDEAASSLRISRKFLHGIEEGDYSGWPARVFSSGYIRAYAKLLSQDPEPVLSEYYQSMDQRPVGQYPVHEKPEWLERERLREAGEPPMRWPPPWSCSWDAFGMVRHEDGRPAGAGSKQVKPAPPPLPRRRRTPLSGSSRSPDNAVAAVRTEAPPGSPARSRSPAPYRAPPAAGAPAEPVPQSSVASVGGVGPVKSPTSCLSKREN